MLATRGANCITSLGVIMLGCLLGLGATTLILNHIDAISHQQEYMCGGCTVDFGVISILTHVTHQTEYN